MDALFKALGDPARREILDSLRRRDGQTLGEIEGRFAMTRFGVMKHLKVLEEAHLVTTRRAGRFKHHYLNAVPLQQALDRWIEPLLAKPAARAILDLKADLERRPTVTKPDFVLETFIQTSHERLWEALTTGETIARYHFAASAVEGDYAEGQTVTYRTPDGAAMLVNRVLKVQPRDRIEMSFEPGWAGPDAPASRCVYLLEPAGAAMKLRVEHYALPPGQEGVREGWARFAAGLKTWLETGQPMRFGEVAA